MRCHLYDLSFSQESGLCETLVSAGMMPSCTSHQEFSALISQKDSTSWSHWKVAANDHYCFVYLGAGVRPFLAVQEGILGPHSRAFYYYLFGLPHTLAAEETSVYLLCSTSKAPGYYLPVL